MGQFKFEKCLDIEGLYTIEPKIFPDESGIPWNDEIIGIDWPIPEDMKIITSERDSKYPGFSEGISLKPKVR